ncbi:MAG: acetyl-coenzyme A synthetase N-terminal domain-containing protein, partial [Burkholderiales bacterium]
MDKPMWAPSAERIGGANITEFIRLVGERHRVPVRDYAGIYDWSVSEPELFWQAVWSYCGVIAETAGNTVVVGKERMPGARWFPEARLNFAENLLRRRDDAPALVFWGEDRVKTRMTYAELYAEVSRLAQALR